MKIKKARQLLKSFADDTRLRIVNLLNKQDLTVTDLCWILDKNQSNLSKHLARLRLTGIVTDRREGINVYYRLAKPKDKGYKELLDVIIRGFKLGIFKQDLKRLTGGKE